MERVKVIAATNPNCAIPQDPIPTPLSIEGQKQRQNRLQRPLLT